MTTSSIILLGMLLGFIGGLIRIIIKGEIHFPQIKKDDGSFYIKLQDLSELLVGITGGFLAVINLPSIVHNNEILFLIQTGLLGGIGAGGLFDSFHVRGIKEKKENINEKEKKYDIEQ